MAAHDNSMPPPPLPSPEVGSVHVIIDPDVVHVVLAGEIDASIAPDLTAAAAEVLDTSLRVDVDCRSVTFMDSTGIGFLARLAARSQYPVRLLHPPSIVRFLLTTVQITSLVQIVED